MKALFEWDNGFHYPRNAPDRVTWSLQGTVN